MSAPVIVSTNPASGDADTVLGSAITVVFDQAIDPTTVSAATFGVFGPGRTERIGPEQMALNLPIFKGQEIVTGTFSFPNATTVVFTPARPFLPNIQYNVIIAGAGTALSLSAVKNLAGQALASSYSWQFTTGALNLATPPPASPVSWESTQQNFTRPRLDPDSITVVPRAITGNDLTQTIELIFPGPVDPASFDPADLLVSVEAFLGDPMVTVPSNLTSTVVVNGNKITITITGWSS